MRWIRQYTLYTYTKQRYHRWFMCIVAAIFVFSYILAWLSPADGNKVFVELSVSLFEVIYILWALVIAVAIANKRSDSTTHIVHSQWLSYQRIFIAHRMVGLTILLYMCIAFSVGLLIAMMVWVLIDGIILMWLYLCIKAVLLYTIVFVVAHHATAIIAATLWLSFYLLFYSIWLIQSRVESMGPIIQFLISIIAYILPHFMSIWQNPMHINWLSTNIFTIVITYGMYIITLLIIGSKTYNRINRK